MTTSVSLGLLSDLFQFIDKYSPFNEMFETDEELLAKLRGQSEQRHKRAGDDVGQEAKDFGDAPWGSPSRASRRHP